MERTKVNSVVNNTAKVPKNQAFWRSGSKAVTRFRVQLVMTTSITLHNQRFSSVPGWRPISIREKEFVCKQPIPFSY